VADLVANETNKILIDPDVWVRTFLPLCLCYVYVLFVISGLRSTCVWFIYQYRQYSHYMQEEIHHDAEHLVRVESTDEGTLASWRRPLLGVAVRQDKHMVVINRALKRD
jgi:hypothetical protein